MNKFLLQASICFALVMSILLDVTVGIPLLLGMDVHLGPNVSVNPASFWGWVAAGALLVLQAVLIGMLIRFRKG